MLSNRSTPSEVLIPVLGYPDIGEAHQDVARAFPRVR